MLLLRRRTAGVEYVPNLLVGGDQGPLPHFPSGILEGAAKLDRRAYCPDVAYEAEGVHGAGGLTHRRVAKNSCNSRTDSAARTPSTISRRWFSRSESARRNLLRTPPKRRSLAAKTSVPTRAATSAPAHITHGSRGV